MNIMINKFSEFLNDNYCINLTVDELINTKFFTLNEISNDTEKLYTYKDYKFNIQNINTERILNDMNDTDLKNYITILFKLISIYYEHFIETENRNYINKELTLNKNLIFLTLDSLDIFQYTLNIEEEFEIANISDNDIKDFTNILLITNYIYSKEYFSND